MSHRVALRKRKNYSRLAPRLAVSVIVLSLFAAATSAIARNNENHHVRIVTLSTRPDTVSGGDVLVEIDVPGRVELQDVKVTLNGQDITNAFRPNPNGQRALLGLVEGLRLGENRLIAHANGGGSDELTLTNYPITGPIFSGPHETPFICMTNAFRVPTPSTAGGATLGVPLDANCSIATRVDYIYRTTAGAYKLLPNPPIHPTDLAQTTTTLGRTVPYIVRIETGTINRAIYQTAILHDPTTESTPSPFNPPAAWNHRLVYTLGGGCVGGWYIQGSSIGSGFGDGVAEDLMLRQGYAVAGSTLNVFGQNCAEVLAGESLMMVKERFIESYGAPLFTIGWGCSGGSEQNQPIADDYPGLMDGIVPMCSFPDVTSANILNVTDADLLFHHFASTTLPWTDDQKNAVTGYPSVATIAVLGPPNAIRVKAPGSCNPALPANLIYNKVTNPHGVRCDVYDHMVNIFGRDPMTGAARRPLDNVGVQYGLGALRAGKISKPQFLDLNKNIGGYDDDGNNVPGRTVADLEAVRIAYRTGRVTYGGQGLANIPIIDYRGYWDQIPALAVHENFHSYSMRARLLRANGNSDNQVMLIEDSAYFGFFNFDVSPVVIGVLSQMDQWLTNLKADRSDARIEVKLRRARPNTLVDACFTDNGTHKIAEPLRFQAGACDALYHSFSSPRLVAGEPLANDVLKCQLKKIDDADYTVAFTPAEKAQLEAIFPEGVCDYSKPGVGQKPFEDTWGFF